MEQAAHSAIEQAVPGSSMVTGLAAYGPLGIIMGVFLLVGLYMFKKMFDRTMTSADATGTATGQKLDQVIAGVEGIKSSIEMTKNEIFRYLEMERRSNTPLPVSTSDLPTVPNRRPR